MATKKNQKPERNYIVVDYDGRDFVCFETKEQVTRNFEDMVANAGIKDEDVQSMLDTDFLVLDKSMNQVQLEYRVKAEVAVLDPKVLAPAVAKKTRKK